MIVVTFAVQLCNGRKLPVTIKTSALEQSLSSLFDAIANALSEQLSTENGSTTSVSPYSLFIDVPNNWQRDSGIQSIPCPPPLPCDAYHRHELPEEFSLYTVKPDYQPPQTGENLQTTLNALHTLQRVSTDKNVLPHIYNILCNYLLVVRVTDSIVPNSALPTNDGTITTKHQAIKLVYEENPPFHDSDLTTSQYQVCKSCETHAINAFKSLPTQFQNDPDVLLAICGMGYSARLIISHCSDHMEKAFLMQWIASGGHLTNLAQFKSHVLWDDPDIVLLLMKTSWNPSVYYEYISNRLKTDREIVNAALNVDGQVLKVCPPEVCNNREHVLTAVTTTGIALEHVSERYKSDQEIVTAALRSDGLALEFVPRRLQADITLVKIAIRQNGHSIQFAQRPLRNNLQLGFQAVEGTSEAYRHLSELLFSTVAQKDPRTLKIAPAWFKNQYEWVYLACVSRYQNIRRDSGKVVHALQYANEQHRNNPQLVSGVIEVHPLALEYASDTLRGTPHIVKAATNMQPQSYELQTKS